MNSTPDLGSPYERIAFEADAEECQTPSQLLGHQGMVRFHTLYNAHVLAKRSEHEREKKIRLPDPFLPDFGGLSNPDYFYHVREMHELYMRWKDEGRIYVTDEVHSKVEATYALLRENSERVEAFDKTLKVPFKD